ncbi:MAG TPA: M48 family metallopeptidase [Anaerohalosphaeraceae bacterium]|mgnify:CR=1 FL=1|nr:M48 family metallopeptidase [Phycisphaerae bacterium]HOK94945.1 M48 family metallopeptidase [Anaerohalosphaeraceae bacterium]HOL31164.1 M48 family metallopeptidase [Anaerohalosphaeraceae bacterium]HOM75941.1 M48 family metallopeptidase [Anaerohalosphaeraceae bacterium]HPC63491.1 M48 family metallopeptidase [Anaerohalosphaeraceae bacterium]
MKRCRIFRVVLIAVFMAAMAGCTTVPITGRSQFNTVPDPLINSMALQEYNSFLKDPETKLSTDPDKTAMVQRVGKRIADAVERYMNENYMNDRIAGYKWEFNLVESKEKNAWAMPGGKVVVYTGLLEVTQDDAGLAVVMGHEIAHAIAKHGAERMSQALMVTLGGIGLSQAMKDKPEATRNIFLSSYGVGASLAVILPYSRLHEKEADQLGLIFMAMAGYDPEAAVGFWERMAASKEGSQIPEFLSTHPADQTRIQSIKEYLPEARRYYKPQGQQAPQSQQTGKLGVYGL